MRRRKGGTEIFRVKRAVRIQHFTMVHGNGASSDSVMQHQPFSSGTVLSEINDISSGHTADDPDGFQFHDAPDRRNILPVDPDRIAVMHFRRGGFPVGDSLTPEFGTPALANLALINITHADRRFIQCDRIKVFVRSDDFCCPVLEKES